tara:strand:+ start:543 stop:716 length:174 start_codon:yes stop_codon:yes gene_type:complete
MSILSAVIKNQVKKRGLLGLLIKVGDMVVKSTPNKNDNEVWEKVRAFLLELKSQSGK